MSVLIVGVKAVIMVVRSGVISVLVSITGVAVSLVGVPLVAQAQLAQPAEVSVVDQDLMVRAPRAVRVGFRGGRAARPLCCGPDGRRLTLKPSEDNPNPIGLGTTGTNGQRDLACPPLTLEKGG